MLDSFDQQYTVFRNLGKFKNIPDISGLIQSGGWKMSEEICNYVNNLSEEMVSPEDLSKDKDSSVAVLGEIIVRYQKLLDDENLIDFSLDRLA